METAHTGFRPSGEKRRILLVEDEPVNQEILKMYLCESYEVLSAWTGSEALEMIHTLYETISLILLDLNLPDLHGLDVLRKLKSDVRYARIPVIVMTADSEAEVECLTLGAIDFIPKPYPMQKVVLARVLRTIELSEDRDILRWTERDQLTGLYNKEFFYRYAMQLDVYHKDDPTDAVLMNINHFHTINDRYGKSYGDEVLRRIGARLRELVEETGGIACRSEADTFLLYRPCRQDYEKLPEEISSCINEGESENRIRLRMGVYSRVDKALDIERRFDRAKMAADLLKKNMTGSVGFYDDSMHEAELLSEQLIEDFPAAVREKQFEVYFQPKFSVNPGDALLSSAEALVRWRHPKLGMISPGLFIPLFESNGLIQALDYYVWSEAAAKVREWKTRLNLTLPVSVNVSRVDLYDPHLIEKLQELVRKNGLDHRDLLLEITESAYTENADQIVEKVRQLKKIGFLIEMDDFGSGYSSLNMLSTLPIDALKLDMQFIRNAFRERKDTRLLEAMIQMAQSLGVSTIAEGVETAEQVFTLKTMGCNVIQGYYFSRPLPAAEFEAFVKKHRTAPSELRTARPQRGRDRFTYNAMHDPLTGLYNYSAFDILFHDADHDHIAVMIAEIDGYARIRKEQGRAAVEQLALRVAGVLRKSFRSVDHLCRLKEDEFAVIMSRITSNDRDLVFGKFERLNRELAREADGTGPVILRVGVAFSDRERPGGDVFEDADTALQRLKEEDRTGYAVF